MKIECALKLRDRMKSALADVYRHARHFGLTSAELATARRAILQAPQYSKAPHWVRAYNNGYSDAVVDSLYRYDLVFGGLVNGVFYSVHRDSADYYEKNGMNPHDYSDDGRVQARGHYWKAFVDKGEPRLFFSSKAAI